MGGCACGIIEASYDNERDASNYSRMARERRADAERMIADAERFEEKAKRLNNGGVECEPCEGRGAYDFMGDGCTEWEPCKECDGFGITRALTCADHSDITEEDLKETEIFLWSLSRDTVLTVNIPRMVMRLSGVRDKLPGSSDNWLGRHWAWSQVW